MACRPRFYDNSAEQLRYAAVRHLCAVVEPKIKNAPDGCVLLSTLGNKENAALAVILMGDLLQRPITSPSSTDSFSQAVFTKKRAGKSSAWGWPCLR